MRILGLSGSLREDSLNTRLLAGARSLLPSGAELVVFEGLAAVPYYSEDDELPTPAAVADLASAVAEANAVLIATPEYNGSIPGHLKNALDWISRPEPGDRPLEVFRGKVAAILSASPGPGAGKRGLRHLRELLEMMQVHVIPQELSIAKSTDGLDAEGRPTRPEDQAALRELASALGAATLRKAATAA